MNDRQRCRRAANAMWLLCLANVAPVLLLAALGAAATATVFPEQKYNYPWALFIGLLILGLPLAAVQGFVRRGHLGAIVLALVIELLLAAALVWFAAGVLAGEFLLQFKLLAVVLAVLVLGIYGWAIASLARAVPEVRQAGRGKPS